MPTGKSASQKMSDYVPPKNWDELTADEKIERMREIIKNLSNNYSRLQNELHNVRVKLARHEHKEGKVFVSKPVQEYDDSNNTLEGIATASMSQGGYF